MKTIFISILLISLYSSIYSQSITNVQSSREYDSIIVTYTLNCDNVVDIDLFYSDNGGTTYIGPLQNLSGDVGASIRAGNHKIKWRVLDEIKFLAGEHIVFKIVGSPSRFSEFKDSRDGHIYKTVRIDKQTWMSENMAYRATTGCWAYENNESYVPKYGRLYTYETATKVCPAGWHLPSEEEWKQLEFTLGMTVAEVDIENFRGKDVGLKLKSKNGWTNNRNGNNFSGFSALPSGYRNPASPLCTFCNLDFAFYVWTRTPSGSTSSWGRRLDGDNNKVLRYKYETNMGFSVRCVKD